LIAHTIPDLFDALAKDVLQYPDNRLKDEDTDMQYDHPLRITH
jgi:hypothetical protein